MCNEINPAVEANHVQAKRNAEAFSAATKRAAAEATAFTEALKQRKTKSATLALITRVAVALLAIILVRLLRNSDHISVEVSVIGTLLVWGWLGIWVGAWLQFMYGKEGLLR